MLTRADRQDAPLREVIESALAARDDEPGRINVDGPAVLLRSSLAGAVRLSSHESAANAVKHGAPSVPGGRVEIAWSVSRT